MLEEFGVRGVRVDEVFDLDMLSEAGCVSEIVDIGLGKLC